MMGTCKIWIRWWVHVQFQKPTHTNSLAAQFNACELWQFKTKKDATSIRNWESTGTWSCGTQVLLWIGIHHTPIKCVQGWLQKSASILILHIFRNIVPKYQCTYCHFRSWRVQKQRHQTCLCSLLSFWALLDSAIMALFIIESNDACMTPKSLVEIWQLLGEKRLDKLGQKKCIIREPIVCIKGGGIFIFCSMCRGHSMDISLMRHA